jgi:hypothetical protein
MKRGFVMRKLGLVMLCAAFGAGCYSGPDVSPLEVGLGAAASLGMTSVLALQAGGGSAALCTSATNTCTTYPCTAGVAINLGTDCPLPLGGVASGTVDITINFSTKDHATMVSEFINATAGDHESTAVVKATDLTVTRDSTGQVTVAFVGQNVNVAGATALTAQSSWTVKVDTMGTPDDTNDDVLTVDGADQGVAGISVKQVTATNVKLDPSCTLNPVSGMGVIQEVSTFHISQDTINFHSACDGKADVDGHLTTVDFLVAK